MQPGDNADLSARLIEKSKGYLSQGSTISSVESYPGNESNSSTRYTTTNVERSPGSASSALFEDNPRSETAGTVLSAQLKRLYREISLLEAKVSREDGDDTLDRLRVMLEGEEKKDDNTERDRWKRLLEDHKK